MDAVDVFFLNYKGKKPVVQGSKRKPPALLVVSTLMAATENDNKGVGRLQFGQARREVVTMIELAPRREGINAPDLTQARSIDTYIRC